MNKMSVVLSYQTTEDLLKQYLGGIPSPLLSIVADYEGRRYLPILRIPSHTLFGLRDDVIST